MKNKVLLLSLMYCFSPLLYSAQQVNQSEKETVANGLKHFNADHQNIFQAKPIRKNLILLTVSVYQDTQLPEDNLGLILYEYSKDTHGELSITFKTVKQFPRGFNTETFEEDFKDTTFLENYLLPEPSIK